MQDSGWEETHNVVQEARAVFAQGDDLEKIRDVRRALQENEAARSQQRQKMKECIKDVENQSVEWLHAKMDEVDQQRFLVAKAINTLEEQYESLDRALQEQNENISALRQRQQLAQQESVELISDDEDRSALSLYSMVSNIHWDLDDDNVKGYVCDKEKNDIRPFNLSRSKLTSHFITNYIWDLI